MRLIPASAFKARCLGLLDEVATTGDPLVVTRHGKPVAQIVPYPDATETPNPLAGTVVFEEDIVSPLDVEWESQ